MSLNNDGKINGKTIQMFDLWWNAMMVRQDYQRWSEKSFIEDILKVSTCSFYRKRKMIRAKADLIPAYIEYRKNKGMPTEDETIKFVFDKILNY